MSCCNCGQPERLCRCPKGNGGAPKRAYIAECTDCDPCRPCKSMVKICSFVAPTLTEGQRFRNSFIYNQEDDSVYYIDDAGTPTRFGSSPMFIDNFQPDARPIPRQIVFDFINNRAYVYNPEGEYVTINLAGSGSARKKLHVYCPVIGDYISYSGGRYGRAKLAFGPSLETESVEIKDSDGNTVTESDFTNLGDKLIDYTFVVHVPQMNEVGPGGGTIIVPQQTFVIAPTMSALGESGDRIISGIGYEDESWNIGVVTSGSEAAFDATLFVNALRGA